MNSDENTSYINEYMQEINDLVVKGLYLSILGNSVNEMSREEAEFQNKYNHLSDRVVPSDFKISEEMMNSSNLPMW
jgi:CRISPR/Cas system-associated endonuclease Cas1